MQGRKSKTVKFQIQPLQAVRGRSRSRRGRRNRGSRRGSLVSAASQPAVKYTVTEPQSTPARYDADIKSAVTKQTGFVKHEEYGDGIRVSGMDVIASAGLNQNDDGAFFSYAGSYPGNSNSKLMLHPRNFPRLYQMAQMYARYAFRLVSIEYCPGTGTNTNGQFAIGFSNDAGTAVGSGTKFSNVLAWAGAKALSWFSKGGVVNRYLGKFAWPLNEAVTTATDYILRQVNQGAIVGKTPTDAAPVAYIYGTLCVRYVCDLFSPISGNVLSTTLYDELIYFYSSEQLTILVSKLQAKRVEKQAEEAKARKAAQERAAEDISPLLKFLEESKEGTKEGEKKEKDLTEVSPLPRPRRKEK